MPMYSKQRQVYNKSMDYDALAKQLGGVASSPADNAKDDFDTLAQELGGTSAPVETKKPTIDEQKIERQKQGLPVSVRKDRVDPTLAGSIVRGIASVPLKIATVFPAAFRGEKGVTVKTKYLGDISDPLTNIKKASERIADKYNKGEITKAGAITRAALGQPLIETLDVASLIPAGGATTGVVKATTAATLKQAPKILTKELAKDAVKTFARGAGYGVGYDVGSQMASGEKYNPLQTVKSAAIGGALDVGLSVGLPAAISGTKQYYSGPARQARAVSKLEKSLENNVFGTTKTGIKAVQKAKDVKGYSIPKFMAEKGLVPEVVDGKFDTRAVVQSLYDDVSRLDEIADEALKLRPERVSLDDYERAVLKAIDNSQARASGELPRMKKELSNLMSRYREIYGNEVDIPTMNAIKQQRAKASGVFDATKPQFSKDLDYQASKVARNIVLNTVKDDAPVRELLGYTGQHLEAIKALGKVQGNVAKFGRMGRHFNRLIGSVIGSSVGGGNPLTGILGSVAADYVTDMMVKNSVTSPMARSILAKLEINDPEIVTKVIKYIDDVQAQRATQLRLPAPAERMPGNVAPTSKTTVTNDLAEFYRLQDLPVPPGAQYSEPYIPQSKLPVIQAGNVARKAINLPVAEGTPKVYTPKPSVEPYIPTEKLPVIDMGEAPKPKKVNLPTVKANSTELPKVATPDYRNRSNSQVPTKKAITTETKKVIDTKPIASQVGKVKSATINVDGKVVNVTPKTKASLESAKEMAKKKGTESAAYAMFGLEVDEDGEISYDPAKAAAFMFAGSVLGSEKSKQIFKGFSDLSLKTLERMAGKSKVSKQFILDQLKREDVVKPERVLMETMLKDMGDDISVNDFANRVKTELLPLKRKIAEKPPINRYENGVTTRDTSKGRYENVALPKDVRGDVKSYNEHIYESPIKTTAGEVHWRRGESENYFAHARIEDMADGKTRRVIEVQSDLMQKGGLENELNIIPKNYPSSPIKKAKPGTKRFKEISKLEVYRDDWYKRIIPEEVKASAQDGKSRVLFPTGETAMKVEGLGQVDTGAWKIIKENADKKSGFPYQAIGDLTKDSLKDIKPGQLVDNLGDQWVITDVLEDGKFKAVPKDIIDKALRLQKVKDPEIARQLIEGKYLAGMNEYTEQFDISGKVDTNNPIYRFYDGDVKKYLKRFNAKEITDENGVSWFEVPITKEMKDMPVGAFGYIAPSDRPKVELPKPKAKVALPKATSPLEQEAKKYKSAEEFANNVGGIRDNFDWSYLDEMKARKAADESYSHSDFNYLSKIEATKRGKESRTFYRAGSIGKDGDIWLTPQEAGATQYGSAGGTKVGEYKVATQNPLILQDVKSIEKVLGKKLASESNFTNNPAQKQAVIDYAKKNGYDSVLMPDSFPDGAAGMESLVVWDRNLVKTKSQLTDIWKKANKK